MCSNSSHGATERSKCGWCNGATEFLFDLILIKHFYFNRYYVANDHCFEQPSSKAKPDVKKYWELVPFLQP